MLRLNVWYDNSEIQFTANASTASKVYPWKLVVCASYRVSFHDTQMRVGGHMKKVHSYIQGEKENFHLLWKENKSTDKSIQYQVESAMAELISRIKATHLVLIN